MHKQMGMMGMGVLMTALLAGCPGGPVIGPTPSASPSSAGITVNGQIVANLPSPLEIATVTGLKASACAEEKNLKSGSGPSTNIKFKNSSSAKIRVYWLDSTGKRVEYINGQQTTAANGGLAAGASFDQQTFVTHPWVITTDGGDCIGIYTPTDTSNVTLDITKTVSITGSASGSGSGSGTGTVTGGSATEIKVRQSVECLKAKGKNSEAAAVQGTLNLYLEAQKQGGISATIFGSAQLQSAIDIAARNGC